MSKYDRYLRLVTWANLRYRDSKGFIITHKGLNPAPYTRIERMAAVKILGIHPGAL